MSRVLIVDDHPVIRMAIRMLLEKQGHQIVGETDNGVDALTMAKTLMPDLLILDIGIPRLDGLEVISRLAAAELPLKILVLTGQSASTFAARCMQIGASGFVCKQEGLNGLVSAVNAVLTGYTYFPRDATRPNRENSKQLNEQDSLDRLSDREMAVFQHLVSGLSNKEISEQMLISNKTVSTYKVRLLLKLNAHSVVDLVEIAKRNALI